jgi:hypothetical protein
MLAAGCPQAVQVPQLLPRAKVDLHMAHGLATHRKLEFVGQQLALEDRDRRRRIGFAPCHRDLGSVIGRRAYSPYCQSWPMKRA